MSCDIRYIGMDVHKEAVVIAVLSGRGKLVMESIVETKASSILQFIHGLRGKLHVTWEEGTWAGWQVAIARKLYDDSSDMLVAFADTDHPIRRGFGRPTFQFRCERTARFFSCLLNPVRRESPELQFPKISQETLAEVVGTTRSREVGDDHIGPVSCCASKHFAECNL